MGFRSGGLIERKEADMSSKTTPRAGKGRCWGAGLGVRLLAVLALVMVSGPLFAAAKDFAAGMDAYKQKKYLEASEKLKAYLDGKDLEDMKAHEAFLALGGSYEQLGRPISALRTYQGFIKRFPRSDKEADARRNLGRCNEAAGRFMDAISAYKEYLVRFSNRPEAAEIRFRIASIYDNILHRYKEAAQEYRDLVSVDTDKARKQQAARRIPQLWEIMGNNAKAVDEYRAYLKSYPDDVQAWSRLFVLLENELRDYKAAVAAIQDYLKQVPKAQDHYERLMHVGYLYWHNLSKWKEAVNAYEEAFKLRPNPEPRFYIVYAKRMAGDEAAFVAEARDFIKKYPRDPKLRDVYRYMIDFYRSKQNRDKAAEVAQEMVEKLKSDDADNYFLLGSVLYDAGKYAEALAAYDKVASINNLYANGDIHVYRMRCHIQMKKFDDAEKFAQATVKEFDNNPRVFNYMTYTLAKDVYQDRKEYDKAIEQYKQIYMRYPWYGWWASFEGAGRRIIECYTAKEEPVKAINLFYELFKVHKNNRNIQNGITGMAPILKKYFRKGTAEKLAEMIDAARKEEAEMNKATAAADHLMGLGKYQEALDGYLEIMKKYEKEIDLDWYRRRIVWDLCTHRWRNQKLARQYAAQYYKETKSAYWLQLLIQLNYQYDPKDYKAALDLLQQAADRKDMDSWWVAGTMYDTYMAMQKPSEAAGWIERWLQTNPKHPNVPDAMYRAGEARRGMGNAFQALKWFRALQEQYPHHGVTLQACYRVQESIKQGNYKEAMLQKWMTDNPNYGGNAEACRRMGNTYEYQKKYDDALRYYQMGSDKFGRAGDWQTMRCMVGVARIYEIKKQTDKQMEALEALTTRFGSYGHWGELATAWQTLLNHYRETNKPLPVVMAYCHRMQNAWRRHWLSLSTGLTEGEILRDRGDYMGGLIAWHKAIFLTNDDRNSWNQVVKFANKLMDQKNFEAGAVIFRSLLDSNAKVTGKDRKDVEVSMGNCWSHVGGSIVEIDQNDPARDLLMGDILAQQGEEEIAWERFLRNRAQFDKNKHKLSPAYIYLIVKRLMMLKKGKESVEIARQFLIDRAKEKHISASDRAKIQLLIGENYMREERFELARAEFESCRNLYPNTPEAEEAQFNVGECYLKQKNHDRALEIFEKLSTGKDNNTAARGLLMRGVTYFDKGDFETAKEMFRQVLSMNPNEELVNKVFFSLGDIYLKRSKYTEAKALLDLVGSGASSTAKRLIQPGRPLKIRLTDRELNVAARRDTVPIVLKTKYGDLEKVDLAISEAGSGIFVGSIDTALGDPKPNDDLLQVRGDDVITYNYAPEVLLSMTNVKLTHPEIRVASDAELEASAAEILTKEEKLKQKEEQEMARQLGRLSDRRTMFRRGDEFKPGNFIYVQVEDPDQDLTADRDKIRITATASSGDKVEVEVAETEAHSGVFRGKIQTSSRPPYAISSDNAEGQPADNAIDSDPVKSAWIGERGKTEPRWLAVDLRNVYPIGKVVWKRGRGQTDLRPINYSIQTSFDGKIWSSVAAVPNESIDDFLGGYKELQLRAFRPDTGFRGAGTLGEIQRLIRAAKGVFLQERKTWINEAENPVAINQDYIGVYYGFLYAPRDGTYTFALKASRGGAFVLVNHDYVVGTDKQTARRRQNTQDEWPFRGTIRLAKGAHRVTLFYHGNPKRGTGKVVLGWSKPGGGRIEPIPKEFFSAEQHPEIKEAIQQAATGGSVRVAELTDEVGAEITLGNVLARFVRIFITRNEGDAPAIAQFEVFDREGNKIIPPDINVHALATNDKLEVGPGDEVLVSYRDMKTVKSDPGTTLIAKLKATFFNAQVGAIRYVFEESDRGQRRKEEYKLYRVDPGDRIILQVQDFDEDKTDGRDTVDVYVRSSSGAELKLKALETEPYTGVFTKEVDTSLDGKPGTLKVKQGDEITVGYKDEWNTDPGNPTSREAQVYVNEPTKGQLRIIETRGYVDKEGKVNWSPVPVEQTGNKGVKTVSLHAPFLIEVLDPDRAKSASDEIIVNLKTQPGGDTAEVVCELKGDEALLEGRFVGQIPLLLGDNKSMDFIVKTAGFEGDKIIRRGTKGKKGENVVPVINAAGNDTIVASYTDERYPGGKEPMVLTDKARMLSTGEINFTKSDYEEISKEAHVGEQLYMRVTDGDADTSPDRDTIPVDLSSTSGDKVRVLLTETLGHSGVFTGSLTLGLNPKPNPADKVFEVNFGDTITMEYLDKNNSESAEPLSVKKSVFVVVGTDGNVVAFGRKFKNEDMAVQTQFKIAESYFELAKDHKKLKKEDLAEKEMEDGQKILNETLEEFPDNQYAYQALYLMANLARERGQYDDAIKAYRKVVRDYAETSAAPLSQYQLAICYEKKNDFDKACDEYVRLAYNFPESELVSEVIIRLGEYYYKKKDFKTAIDVFSKFVERYPKHQLADRVFMRVGHCYLLLARRMQELGANNREVYMSAAKHFDEFGVQFPQSKPDYRAQALYWAGDSWLKAGDARQAYRRFKNCIWNYPETDWARHARGRLTAPIFERIQDED